VLAASLFLGRFWWLRLFMPLPERRNFFLFAVATSFFSFGDAHPSAGPVFLSSVLFFVMDHVYRFEPVLVLGSTGLSTFFLTTIIFVLPPGHHSYSPFSGPTPL